MPRKTLAEVSAQAANLRKDLADAEAELKAATASYEKRESDLRVDLKNKDVEIRRLKNQIDERDQKLGRIENTLGRFESSVDTAVEMLYPRERDEWGNLVANEPKPLPDAHEAFVRYLQRNVNMMISELF